MVATLLFGLFLSVVAIQLIYFGLFAFYFPYKNATPSRQTNPCTVIIAARNEETALASNLPTILEQDHPNFELIVVNDASTDDTLAVVESLQQEYSNLRCLQVPAVKNYNGNKKRALKLGIEAATHEHLLFTDADCTPHSNQWLRLMTMKLEGPTKIVLGYGGYQKKAGFLNALIRYETFITAVQYFSAATMGYPYMGVGRNLAYTTSLVSKEHFKSHMHLRSGDDDLFVNEHATAQNTAVMLDQKSFSYSQAKTKLSQWLSQKRRHYSTASAYKIKHQLSLGLFFTSQFLFWSLAIILLFLTFNWRIVISVIAIRLSIQTLSYWRAAKKLKEADFIPFLPILDFSLVLVQTYCGLINLISKPKHW